MSGVLLITMLLGGMRMLGPYPSQTQVTQQSMSLQAANEKAAALCRQAKDKRDLYLGIWKKQFLTRNGMAQSFFDKHVSVDKYEVECEWTSGLSLRVEYKVTYDWAVINQHDQIIVLLYSQEGAYRHLPLPRDTLFTEKEVLYAIDKSVFFSSISPVKALDKLRFSSYEDASKAFQQKIGSKDLQNVQLSFYVPGKLPRQDGSPYLIGKGVLDMKRNVCIDGHMNLVTGEVEARQNACVVN